MPQSIEIQVSHGRGGTGNISTDNIPYGDGEIVREGFAGDQGDGAYSAGRGGAANIGSPGIKPAKVPHDHDSIPEMAIRKSEEGPHHVGRGGGGNIDKGVDTTTHPEGLADKLKHKLFPKKR